MPSCDSSERVLAEFRRGVHLELFMRLPPLDPDSYLKWTWAHQHPGESPPTLAEYALCCGYTESVARKWLIKFAAYRRKLHRLQQRNLMRTSGMADHYEVVDPKDAG